MNEENKVCCVDCGVKYLTQDQKKIGYPVTFHRAKCCVCGKTKDVTSIRHYNNLINKKPVDEALSTNQKGE